MKKQGDISDMFVTNKQLYDELTKVTDKITRLQVIVGAQVAITSYALFAKLGVPPVVPSDAAAALKAWFLTSTLSV